METLQQPDFGVLGNHHDRRKAIPVQLRSEKAQETQETRRTEGDRCKACTAESGGDYNTI